VQEITITYCLVCNYRPIAAALAFNIEQAFGIKPLLVQSRAMGAYEITADGATVFSKLASGRFPDTGEILAALRERMTGEE
jgi:selT/selW/selH-like putative selenoprotein